MKLPLIILLTLLMLSCFVIQGYTQEYVIKPGDTIGISVMDEKDLTKQAVVDPQGNISLPLINQVSVAGMTVMQASETITGKLKQFIKNPQVSVELVQTAKSQVTVTGEVKNPGIIEFSGSQRLIDAITSAGGYTQEADLSKVSVTHRGSSNADIIDLNKFLISGDTSVNILVQNGDTIIIPARETAAIGSVSVLGAVRQGGAKDLTKGMTLREAVMLAGGPTELADLTNVTIRHEGSVDVVKIDYEKASTGDPSSNPELKPGDVIYISTKGKTEYFSVNGAVANPGRFEIKDNLSITEAISLAGGLKPNAKMTVRVVKNTDGTTSTTDVDLKEVYAGKTANISVNSGDNIWVPTKKEGTDYMRILSVAVSLGWLLTR